MLRDDSPLTRLPAALNRRQVVFLDGVRHAAEIVALAHGRLRDTLTEAARTHAASRVLPPHTFPSNFLDAWAIVDAIDRMRSLLLCMPGAVKAQPSDGEPGFIAATQSIRDLRNVSDHLSQRVDYVVARDGTALGKLRWVTRCEESPNDVLSCTLLPGTTAAGKSRIVNPLGRQLKGATDLIILQAGEHEASLSDAVHECHRVIAMIEDSLEKSLLEQNLQGDHAGADVMFAVRVQIASASSPEVPREPAA